METTPKRPRRWRRIFLYSLLGLIGLPVLAAVGMLVYGALLPKASADPTRLTPQQAALTAESLHLKAELGDQLWPGFGDAGIPQLTFSETHAFLCGYPGDPPAGWQPVPDVQVAGGPCYRQEWQDGQNFTLQVGERWVSSMINQEWGRIELRQELTEMMPAPLGQLIGPLFAGIGLQPYRYIGALVHESFHAYQAETARASFDDAERAYPDGEAYWQIDPEQQPAWEAEIEALYGAVRSETDDEARRLARSFLDLRKARRDTYLSGQPDLVLFEQRFEWLEGLAKYIELNSLLQACRTPGYQPVDDLQAVGGFKGYCAAEGFYRQELDQLKRQATTEGDTRFYYTGFAQAELLDRFAPGWKADALQGERLEDLLRAAIE